MDFVSSSCKKQTRLRDFPLSHFFLVLSWVQRPSLHTKGSSPEEGSSSNGILQGERKEDHKGIFLLYLARSTTTEENSPGLKAALVDMDTSRAVDTTMESFEERSVTAAKIQLGREDPATSSLVSTRSSCNCCSRLCVFLSIYSTECSISIFYALTQDSTRRRQIRSHSSSLTSPPPCPICTDPQHPQKPPS